jgi:hypothetical protein
MAEFVLFTHTLWSESPRVRHQVARLLAQAGHDVLFIERAVHPWQGTRTRPAEVEPRIRVAQPRRLLHHQLRLVSPLDWANDTIVRHDFRVILRDAGIGAGASIINFAHDAAFLCDFHPRHRVVTVIHDDFEAQCRFPWFRHVTRNLRATCLASDSVLALSTPLVRRIRKWCRAELFLPWTELPYVPPVEGVDERDTLLFWGHIDVGLDVERIRSLSAHMAAHYPGLRMLFVGPTQVSSRRARTVDPIKDLVNVRVQNAMSLDSLPIGRVLATLIPYRRKGDVDATELPNKALPLLTRGLPILKTGLPAMVRAPFIHAIEDDESFDRAIAMCRAHFWEWQPLIKSFISGYRPEDRLRALGAL